MAFEQSHEPDEPVQDGMGKGVKPEEHVSVLERYRSVIGCTFHVSTMFDRSSTCEAMSVHMAPKSDYLNDEW